MSVWFSSSFGRKSREPQRHRVHSDNAPTPGQFPGKSARELGAFRSMEITIQPPIEHSRNTNQKIDHVILHPCFIRNTNHSKRRAARRSLRRRGVTLLAFCQCNSIRFGAGKPVSAGIESSLVRSSGPHGWRGNPTDKKTGF